MSAKYLAWHILIALALACIVAFSINAAELSAETEASIGNWIGIFGTLFINALKMIVVPLVFAAIAVGVAGMASQKSFGRIGGKTIALYLLTGIIAIFTGLALVNVIQPGNMQIENAQALVTGIEGADASDMAARVEGRSWWDLVQIIVRAVPPNIFDALTNNTGLLAIIFVAVVFGFFTTKLTGAVRETIDNLWQGMYDVTIAVTLWIIRFAPIGVFALVTVVLIQTGFDAFKPLAWFVVTVLAALIIHFFVWLPLMQVFLARVNPLKYYGKVVKAQLTAFSTASSSATLPVTIESAQEAGVSKRVSSFVLPLGATVNMDGTALYECVAVIFIAQIYSVVYGVDLTIVDQLLVVLLALVTSIGVAGVPAASLVAITLILLVLDLPAEWLAIILAVDRILDMCRTSTNVTSDLTIAAIVARSEGEELPEVRTA
ncbi:MAG: dicarboxylate/amino acid:cation symporter [Gammaproteobacteria bacterium]|nr:dicarboxylate/amino acid:cation symporter [Gammaproteobacteria bacterium]